MNDERDPVEDVDPLSGDALLALVFIIPMAVILTAICHQGLLELDGPMRAPHPGLPPPSRSGAITTLWIVTPLAIFLWYAVAIIVVSAFIGRSLPLLSWWAIGSVGC